MREVSDCRLTDVSQHIDNTVSGQPCLEPCWVFMPGYLFSCYPLYIYFVSIAQQVPPNPFVSDKCERLPQSRRKQSACSHFKLFQKRIKTVTLFTRRLRSQRHWQATGMHILTGGKVKERVFYGLRWCFSII